MKMHSLYKNVSEKYVCRAQRKEKEKKSKKRDGTVSKEKVSKKSSN